jgi:flagellar biosynthesis/type III secretory pathway chaperone
MKPDDAQALIDELDTLLDTERTALLAGDIDAMGRLLEQKESLIDALNTLAADTPPLDGLQAKVVRNQALLDGALQGIRRASARMAALRRVRRSLETYDASGQKQTIEGEVVHKVEKRA